jgi:hypothetical protein
MIYRHYIESRYLEQQIQIHWKINDENTKIVKAFALRDKQCSFIQSSESKQSSELPRNYWNDTLRRKSETKMSQSAHVWLMLTPIYVIKRA